MYQVDTERTVKNSILLWYELLDIKIIKPNFCHNLNTQKHNYTKNY